MKFRQIAREKPVVRGPRPRSNSGTRDLHANFVGMYDFKETLGDGNFAVVKLAEHVLSKQRVAVKIIEKKKLSQLDLDHLQKEVHVMKLIRHNHIVRLYQVVETKSRLYLILELGDGGDLFSYIHKRETLPENLARSIFRQIAKAVSYCHKHHVAHRDLKPENIVFCSNRHDQLVVKITDFGLSNSFDPGEKMQTACGSLRYSSPEVLLGDPYDGPAADIWSLGVILYMMIAGRVPFEAHDDSSTLVKIMDVSYEFPEHMSEKCRDLVHSMLQKNPSDRISIDDVLTHSWIGSSHPLIIDQTSKMKLTDSEHDEICRVMFEGAGITRDDIQKALSEDSYDYIASTYHLMLEKMIRKKEKQGKQRQESASKSKERHPLQRAQTSTVLSGLSGVTDLTASLPSNGSSAPVSDSDESESESESPHDRRKRSARRPTEVVDTTTPTKSSMTAGSPEPLKRISIASIESDSFEELGNSLALSPRYSKTFNLNQRKIRRHSSQPQISSSLSPSSRCSIDLESDFVPELNVSDDEYDDEEPPTPIIDEPLSSFPLVEVEECESDIGDHFSEEEYDDNSEPATPLAVDRNFTLSMVMEEEC